MTLPDLTHVEFRNQKAVRTPKKTCPKCKTQVPVARQRCENCPHQFISNADPDCEARKAARKEKKRLRAHHDGIQAAAKRLRAAAEEGAANARETIDFAPDLATHEISLGWRGALVAAPTEGMMLSREASDAAPGRSAGGAGVCARGAHADGCCAGCAGRCAGGASRRAGGAHAD